MRYDITSLKNPKLRLAFEAENIETAKAEANTALNEELTWALKHAKTPEGENMPGLLTTHVAKSATRGRFYMLESNEPLETPVTHPDLFEQPVQMRKRSFSICRRKWHTGMGAESTTRLYSIRQEKELEPQVQNLNKKGKGDQFYCLYPGKYFELGFYASNSKSYGFTLKILRISEKGEEQTMKLTAPPPKWLLDLMPKNAVDQLFPTPHN